MDAEKVYKLLAPVAVGISGLYLYLFLSQRNEWGKKSGWTDVMGLLFLPFVLLTLSLGIGGIVLVFKAKKEKRNKTGLIGATLGYFSGLGILISLLVMLIFGVFQMTIFKGTINP